MLNDKKVEALISVTSVLTATPLEVFKEVFKKSIDAWHEHRFNEYLNCLAQELSGKYGVVVEEQLGLKVVTRTA